MEKLTHCMLSDDVNLYILQTHEDFSLLNRSVTIFFFILALN